MNHLWPVSRTRRRAAAPAGSAHGGVGAHVGAALLLGHAHAEGDAGLGRRRAGSGGRSCETGCAAASLGEARLSEQRGDGRVGHGDRAAVAGLRLRRRYRSAPRARRGRRVRCAAAGCTDASHDRGVQALGNAGLHQLVPGRMELDDVEAAALLVMSAQAGRILVGLSAQRLGLGTADPSTEARQGFCLAGAALARQRPPSVRRRWRRGRDRRAAGSGCRPRGCRSGSCFAPRASAQVLVPEVEHAGPGLLGGGALVGFGALLVHEAVGGNVVVEFDGLAGFLHAFLEAVGGFGSAPGVLRGEVALQGDLDVGRLGDGGGRDAIEADPGGELGHLGGADDRYRAAHAEAGQTDLRARALEELRGAAGRLLGCVEEIERVHLLTGGLAVVIGDDRAGVEIGSERVVSGKRQPITDARDLVLQAPPLLDHHDTGGAGAAGLCQIALRVLAIGAAERDPRTHRDCLLA